MSCCTRTMKNNPEAFLIYVLLNIYVNVISGTIPAEIATAATSSECYGSTLSPACPAGSQIAVTSYRDGFKAASLSCPLDGTATGACCTYDVNGDCLQEAPTESRYVDDCSGRDSSAISTSSVVPSAGGTCDSGSYSAASVFSKLDYICIQGSRITEICVTSTYVSTDGSPVYVQNQGYSGGNSIPTSAISCSCSVEALSATSNIVVYTLHADLYDTASDCHQSLVFKDENDNVMETIECADPTYNLITSETLNNNYISLELINSFTTTNAGRFWIGFEASDGNTQLKMNCPAGKIDCANLTNPTAGTVSWTSTAYSGVATYTCNSGYTRDSGDLTRTCQVDSTWSGTPAICLYECGPLSNPANGEVNLSSTTNGSIATYSCRTNFTLDGDSTRTCVDGTGWSGSQPSCYECLTNDDCTSGMTCIAGQCQFETDNTGNTDDGLQTWEIVLIVIGCIIFVAACVARVVMAVQKLVPGNTACKKSTKVSNEVKKSTKVPLPESAENGLPKTNIEVETEHVTESY